MAGERFLAEFPPVGTEQWEHVIRESVKGADYASKLIWHPEEGLAVRPYYRANDLAGLGFLDAAPGTFPFVRGHRTTGEWLIREEVAIRDLEEANRTACNAIAAGCDEIAFHCPRLENSFDFALLLKNLDEIPVHFKGLDHKSTLLLIDRLKMRPSAAVVSTDLDPLADIDHSVEIFGDAPAGFRPFVIHAEEFQECAAGAIEEVGFALSAAVEFVAEMQKRGIALDCIASSLAFSFAMGPEFFVQIAKLRAFRMVWAKAVESFGGMQEAGIASIHACTARWNKTIYNPHGNTLRATTEVISAILGGADVISAAPFDECYKEPDTNSRRLARNIQILLKKEALLSLVADPLGGAYAIEVLTNSIESKAWKLFQELEAAGGYRRALDDGVIASVLSRRTSSREEAVKCRRRVLTGTNRFANTSEVALGRVDASRVDSAPRTASSFEALRLRTERFTHRTGNQLRILLAEIGDAKMRSSRSQFAADFLASAGFATSIQQFDNAQQIAVSDADVIVLCSSDAEYLSIIKELLPILKDRSSRANVVIAGNPETAEQLRALGVAGFIHLRSNAVEVLAGLQQLIGIED